MLKRARLLALALLAFIPPTAMSAVGPLDVVLTKPTSQDKAEMAFVTLTVTNRSDRSLLLPKTDSALDSDDGYLWNNLLNVVSEQGETVAYRGRSTRVATRERDVRFWTVKPGQTMSAEINLVANYDIQGGVYKVSYSQPFIELKDWNPDGAAYEMVPGNVLEIYANSSLVGRERTLRASSQLTTPSSLAFNAERGQLRVLCRGCENVQR